MPDPPAPDHTLAADEANVHHAWDNSLDPVATVEPVDVVEFDCHDAYDRQLSPGATVADLLGFEHEGWGVSAAPGEREGGLLPEEFPDAHVRTWGLDATADGTRVARFDAADAPDVSVPLHPFPGNLGVAPAADGPYDTMPPRSIGGNMDVKHLTAGATLYLPVAVEGALFSVGDCHVARGDGEVCTTGIEVARNDEAVS